MCLSPSYHQAAEIIPPVIPPFSVTSRLPTWFEMNKYQLAALRFVFTASVSSLFKQLENWSAHWPGVCVVCFYEYFSRVSLGLNLNWVVSFFTPWRTFIKFFFFFFFEQLYCNFVISCMDDSSCNFHVTQPVTESEIVSVQLYWNIVLNV